MSGRLQVLVALALAGGAGPGACQDFQYVEPGVAACPAAPVSVTTEPVTIAPGLASSGRILVGCGFEQGSYTVRLTSTDPGAKFAPSSFLVNFGRLVGNGVFTASFSTLGVQAVSTSITPNMGSPALRGYFAPRVHQFKVVNP